MFRVSIGNEKTQNQHLFVTLDHYCWHHQLYAVPKIRKTLGLHFAQLVTVTCPRILGRSG